MITAQEFSKLFFGMAKAYPAYKPQEGTVDIYYAILKDIDHELLQAAARQVMAENTFFPSIAEWRQAAQRIVSASLPPAESGPEAWSAFLRLNNRNCGDPCPGIELWTSEAAYRAGRGLWAALSGANDEFTISEIRRQFLKAYEQTAKQAAENANLLPASTEYAKRIQDGVSGLTARLSAKVGQR